MGICTLSSDRGQWIDTPLRYRHSNLMNAYEEYLKEYAGSRPRRSFSSSPTYGSFLNTHCGVSREIADLNLRDVERFIALKAKRSGRGTLQMIVGALRAFFRYCQQRNLLTKRLDEIDTPTRFRDERPPRAVPWELAQKLLASIDRRTRMGSRDHAILYLMTHLGYVLARSRTCRSGH